MLVRKPESEITEDEIRNLAKCRKLLAGGRALDEYESQNFWFTSAEAKQETR